MRRLAAFAVILALGLSAGAQIEPGPGGGPIPPAGLARGTRRPPVREPAAPADPADPNADSMAAIQALIDRAQEAARAGGNSSISARVPQAAHPYSVSGPIYLDGHNIELRGDGDGTQIRGGFGYGGPPVVLGIPRLQKIGHDPAAYRLPSVLGGGRMGITTRGTALLSVTAHPLQLGGYPTPSSKYPDYWQSPAYTFEFVIGPGDGVTWKPGVPLFGLSAPAGPWGVFSGPDMTSLQFLIRTATQHPLQYRTFSIPTPGPWPHAVTFQWDSATATAVAWVDGKAQAVTVASTDHSAWAPGETMAAMTCDQPFTFGGFPAWAQFGTLNPLEVHGFIASVGKKYDPAKPTETRSDGLPIPPSRYWDRPAAGGPAATIAFLAMTDAAATHVEVDTATGAGVGFWLVNGGGASANLKVRDLRLTGGIQQALAIGCCFGVDLIGVTASGSSLQGIGSIPYGNTYPVRMERCLVGGFDCAYYGWEQLLWARDTVVSLTGRDGLRTSGGSYSWDGAFFGESIPTAQTFFRQIANAYGGSFTAKNVLIDNEGGGPSVAIIEVEQSPYCPNAVVVDNISISTLRAPASFVHLIGHRTATSKEIYRVGKASLTNLHCYEGSTQPGLLVNGGVGEPAQGIGSWFGTCDLSSIHGTGSGAVADFVFPKFTHTPAP